MNRTDRVGEVFTGYVADLTGNPLGDLPSPEASGEEWLPVLRMWLATRHCGLVPIANPETFSWPGHWMGIVDGPEEGDPPAAVLLFGTPSAVIASPAAPALVGKAAGEVRFREAMVLVPYRPFGQPAADTSRQVGSVVGIYIAGARTAPMTAVECATAVSGTGLLGDRYAAKAGTFTPRSDRIRGYDLTLIESEVLERAALPDGTGLTPEESRRNIVTRGIDLNALVGREFTIGSVRAVGQRLCEPCVHLQRLSRPGVVKALAHRGGLRADILTDGEIRVGDAIEAAAPPS